MVGIYRSRSFLQFNHLGNELLAIMPCSSTGMRASLTEVVPDVQVGVISTDKWLVIVIEMPFCESHLCLYC